MTPRPFVLLDRDGTINREVHYLSRPEQVELLPGSARGLRLLRRHGFGLVVVTNQSGIARGLFDMPTCWAVNQRLSHLLMSEGVSLDGIYFCPHHPDQNCLCRKPKPGMVLRAARELGFDPLRSYVVGDNLCDIQLGRRIGAISLLVLTGHGTIAAQSPLMVAEMVAADLAEAAEMICQAAHGKLGGLVNSHQRQPCAQTAWEG